MRLGITATLGVGVALLVPCTAQGATFEVNEATDDVDAALDGRCDTDTGTSGRQCSLRAALTEANDQPDPDRVEFEGFDGNVVDDTITLVGGPLSVASNVTVDAGSCGPPGFRQPCAGIDAPNGNAGLVAGGREIVLRGVAVHGAAPMGGAGAGLVGFGAKGMVVQGSWFGLRLNGFAEANGNNIELAEGSIGGDTDKAMIGGKRERDANLFAGGGVGVVITGGDRNRILGNRFGVNSQGVSLPATTTAISIRGDGPNVAVGNRVGTKLSRSAARSPNCDGGCNAIARADNYGINLTAGGQEPARDTTIQGNFIGLRPSGASALENELSGIQVGDAGGTTIGGSSRARNYITGGELAVNQQPGSRSLEMRGNFIGFDSTGQTPLDPPDGAGAGFATRIDSEAAAPTTLAGNHFALAPSTTAVALFGDDGVATGNAFGLQRDGDGLPAPADTTAILVAGNGWAIGRPGAGNVIGNTSFATREAIGVIGSGGAFEGDRNLIQGNLVGVDRDGEAHAVVGDGIGLRADAADNRIGGSSAASENVVSNVSDSAIVLSGPAPPRPSGNRIMRNRGSGNGTQLGDLFVELGTTVGFGNGDPSLQGGIEAPAIDDASRTRIEGSGAEPGAEVWVFRTRDPAAASPRNLRGFVTTTGANGAGDWSANFDRIAAADNLTALQTDAGDGSSELALVAAP